MNTSPVTTQFVLFDDAESTARHPSSRLMTGPIDCWSARADGEVADALQCAQDATILGKTVALFVAYEAALALSGLPVARQEEGQAMLVEALSFEHEARLSADAVTAWLQRECARLPQQEASTPCGVAACCPGVEESSYVDALERIAEHLRAGDAYQINFTWPIHARAFGHPIALYSALRQRQPTRYSVFARLSSRWVLSLSPELFFAREGLRLTARPMKGTAPRASDQQADATAARALAEDPKNRAENLMILDLLRNDLGRLAVPGTVRVPERFVVEPYPTVWQMTSAVEALLPKPPPAWSTIFNALFPCGSVTGAPKRSSMAIIRALEGAPRGLYTGAIGFIEGSGERATFNVPIRTLELEAEPSREGENAGTRAVRVGVGSGVVIDSDARAEWRECWDKLRFLTGHDPGFALIETFAAVWPRQGWRIERHLARLRASAAYFGFDFDEAALRAAIAAAHADLDSSAQAGACSADRPRDWAAAVDALAPAPSRTRVALQKDGAFDLDVQAMPEPSASPVRLLLSRARLDSADLFLRHKTTHRARYDAAWREAEAVGAFDQIFLNERDELCEGARSTLFVHLDGGWWTPPRSSGLLPGVARQILLDSGLCQERQLVLGDLSAANMVAVANSLRGVLTVNWHLDGAGG